MDKKTMRETIHKHNAVLLDKIHRMFESGELNQQQMSFAADVLKDIAKADALISKACYYDMAGGDAASKTW